MIPLLETGRIDPDTLAAIEDRFSPQLMAQYKAMLQTSARLLRLLSLFQVQRYWSGTDLSDRLRVTPRTLRRDVDRLRSLGYPVHSTSGVAGGYQLGAGATLPPLLLDDDEAVAVALGLRTSATGAVSGIEEASVRALMKLEQVLPPRLRSRVAALHGFVVPLETRAPRVQADRLSFIANSCRDHEGIRFTYHDRIGSATTRTVEPHRLVHTGYRWYLVAWDLTREDWRTFRVDRVQGKLKTSTRFKPRKPPEGGFATFVSKSIAHVPNPYSARVTLHASMETLARRISPSLGALEAIDTQSCLLHTGAHSLEAITIHLLLLGVGFQVHEPPELVTYIRELTARLSQGVQ
ncbi:MAG TPA: YafY family protein [Candidatus Sulfotelmatobacter sp.]|nr:YafY family protein [Candidatus Sulfotelmatobacter sp.]